MNDKGHPILAVARQEVCDWCYAPIVAMHGQHTRTWKIDPANDGVIIKCTTFWYVAERLFAPWRHQLPGNIFHMANLHVPCIPTKMVDSNSNVFLDSERLGETKRIDTFWYPLDIPRCPQVDQWVSCAAWQIPSHSSVGRRRKGTETWSWPWVTTLKAGSWYSSN